MVVDVKKGNDVELGRPRILFEEHDMPSTSALPGTALRRCTRWSILDAHRRQLTTNDSQRGAELDGTELKRLVPTNK